jgi:hypothetical protein
MTTMKTKIPTAAHTAFRDDLVALLRKHEHLRADEMLAVASYFVGQILALQDQRKMTPAMGLEVVSANIEAGNAHAIKELVGTPLGSA